MLHSPRIKGFTLVELIVVIGIIGILSTLGMSSYSNIQRKARDAKRVADAREIKIALAAYYADNGSYPLSTGTGWNGECNHQWGTPNLAPENVIPGLVPTYLEAFPSDPQMNKIGSGGNTPCYLYRSTGTDFAFLLHNKHVGGDSNYTAHPELFDSHRDGGSNTCLHDGTSYWSWKLNSPGASCF